MSRSESTGVKMARALPSWVRTLIPCLLLACAAGARAETPEQIPDPRQGAYRGSIADAQGKIDSVDRPHIEESVSRLRRDTGAEMVVVVIERTDGRSPKDFATRLFNRWGVGDSQTNLGVLYLIVLEARRMEVEVGVGLENDLTPANMDPLLVERVVPYFKRGDVSSGVRVGTEAIAELVRSVTQTPGPVSPVQVAGFQPSSSFPAAPLSPGTPLVEHPTYHKPPNDQIARLKSFLTPNPPVPAWSVILCWFTLCMLLVGCRSGIDDEGFSCARMGIFFCLAACAMVWVEHTYHEEKPSGIESLFKFYLILLIYITLFPWTGWVSAHSMVSLGTAWVAGLYFASLAGIVLVGMAVMGPGAQPGTLMYVPHGNHELHVMVHMLTFVPLLMMAGRLSRYIPPMCGKCNQVSYLLSEEADDAHLEPGELKEEKLGTVDYDVWVCPGCSGKEKRRHASWMSGHSTCSRCTYVTVMTSHHTIRHATYSHSGEGCRTDTCRHCGHTSTSHYIISRKTRSSSSSSSRSSSRSSSGGGRSSGGGGGGASW